MLIRLENVGITYKTKSGYTSVLQNINLTVNKGEFVAITGPSGAGKSTLLNIIGLLERPTAGTYYFMGQKVSSYRGLKLATLRNKHLGFVFQDFELIYDLTVYKNVELPLVYAGVPRRRRKEKVEQVLSRLGLKERLHYLPVQLSGGQQQRVALARAVVTGPDLIICDEPTGNLDSRSTETILCLLEDLHRDGSTIILVTHDPAVARRAHRSVIIEDGRIVADTIDGKNRKVVAAK